MDAIRLHKNGFRETVASLGTSLTPEQAEILSRYADRCYICYDSDTAGQKATIRSMYALQKHGLDVYVMNLPDKKDPDEYLTEHSPEDFEEEIKEARPLVVQHIEMLKPLLSDTLTRKSAQRELFGTLSELGLSEVFEYTKQLSEATGILPNQIREWFLSRGKRKLPEEARKQVRGDIEHPCEAVLCSLLLKDADFRQRLTIEEVQKLLKDDTARDTAIAILTEDVESLMELWTSLGETRKLGLLARGEEYSRQMKEGSERDKWIGIYKELRKRYKSERIEEITLRVQKSQATAEELSELIRLKGESRCEN